MWLPKKRRAQGNRKSQKGAKRAETMKDKRREWSWRVFQVIGVCFETWLPLDESLCSGDILFVHVWGVSQLEPGDIKNDTGVFTSVSFVRIHYEVSKECSTSGAQLTVFCNPRKMCDADVEDWFLNRDASSDSNGMHRTTEFSANAWSWTLWRIVHVVLVCWVICRSNTR